METEIEERFEKAFNSSQSLPRSLVVLDEVARSRQDDAKYRWLQEKYSRVLSVVENRNEYQAILQHQLDLLDHEDERLRSFLLEIIPFSVSDECKEVGVVCSRLSSLADAVPSSLVAILHCLSKIEGARRYCIDWVTDCALSRLNADDLAVFLPHLLVHLVRTSGEASAVFPVIRSRVHKIADAAKQLHVIDSITQAILSNPHDDILFEAYQKHLIDHDSEALTLLDAVILLACSHGADLRQWLPHIPIALVEKAFDLDQTKENQVWIIEACLSSKNYVYEVLVRLYRRLSSTKRRELVAMILSQHLHLLTLLEKLTQSSAIEDIMPLLGLLVCVLQKERNEDRIEILSRIVAKAYSKSPSLANNFRTLLKSLLSSLRRDNRLKGLYMAREAIHCDETLDIMVRGLISRILFPPWRSPIDPKTGILCVDCLQSLKPLDFSALQILLANTGLIQELRCYQCRNGCLLAFKSSHDIEKNQIVFCVKFFLDIAEVRNDPSWVDCVLWVFRLLDTYLQTGSKESGKRWKASTWLSSILELPLLVLPPSLCLSSIEEHMNNFHAPMATLLTKGYHGCICFWVANDDQALEILEAVSRYMKAICLCGAMLAAVLNNTCRSFNGTTTTSAVDCEQLSRLFVLASKAQLCKGLLDKVSSQLRKKAKNSKRQRQESIEDHEPMVLAPKHPQVDNATVITTLADVADLVFWTPSFLSLEVLWRSLDTKSLLRTVQQQSTCLLPSAERSLVLHAFVCTHLTSGFERGQFSSSDLKPEHASKCFSFFPDLFRIIEDFPAMLVRQQSKNSKLCCLSEEAVVALMRLLGIVAECVIPETWDNRESCQTISTLQHFEENTFHQRSPAAAVFTHLTDRIKIVGSRNVCESSMDLLLRLGMLVGKEETNRVLENSWSSLRNTLEHHDVQDETIDEVHFSKSVHFLSSPTLPADMQETIQDLCERLEDPLSLVDSGKRTNTCEALLRHFARVFVAQHLTTLKNVIDAQFLISQAKTYISSVGRKNSMIQGASLPFETMFLICTVSFVHICKKPLTSTSRELLQIFLSFFGDLVKLFAENWTIFPESTGAIMLRCSDAVVCGLVSAFEITPSTNPSIYQILLDHTTKNVLGVFAALLDLCQSKKLSRVQSSFLRHLEKARREAQTRLSVCAESNNLEIPREKGASSLANVNRPHTTDEVRFDDAMSIDASFNANWGADDGSSGQSLELETPALVVQTM